jgi:hypothetical protein
MPTDAVKSEVQEYCSEEYRSDEIPTWPGGKEGLRGGRA